MADDIGAAIGEQASGPDRAGMLTQIAENREQFIEEGKKRAAEAQVKSKESAYGKDYKFLLDKLQGSGVDIAMQPALEESAKKTYASLGEIYNNTRTPEEFDQQAAPELLDFNKNLQTLKQSGENYKLWRNLTDEQLKNLPLDQKAIAMAVQNGDDYRDIGKKIDEYQKNGLSLFSANLYNSQNGLLGKPDPALGKQNEVDLIGKFVKGVNDGWAQELGKKFTVNSTEYQQAVNYLPLTDADAQQMAKQMGLSPDVKMPSVESKTNAFLKTPEGKATMASWFKSQFTDGQLDADGKPIGAYRENAEKYFMPNPNVGQGQPAFIPNNDKIQEDFKKYVSDQVEAGEKYAGKNIVGRQPNSNSYGSVENRQKDFNAKAAIIKAAVDKAKAEQSKVNSNRRATQSEKDAAETAVQTLTQQQSTLENSREDFESGKFNGSIDELPGWKEYAASTGATTTATSKDDDFSQYKRK